MKALRKLNQISMWFIPEHLKADAEGRFRFIVAHENPGVPNWIDTEGHTMGTLYWRFLLPEGELEQPLCEVVSLASLRES